MNFYKNIFITVLFFITLQSVRGQNVSTQEYINQYKDLAISEMKRTGIPAAIKLAQGILESGSGNSRLALISNNHFGIKCKSEWTGDRVFYNDDAKGECFRKYNSVAESFIDHSNFLKERDHYASLFLLDPTDYTAWAKGLKKAGYATSTTYPERLIKVIEDNNLQEFSLLTLNQPSINSEIKDKIIEVSAKDSVAKLLEIEVAIETEIDSTSEDETEVKDLQTDSSNSSIYPNGLFSINNTKVVYLKKGVSLFAIANKYNISFKNILDFNHLESEEILNQDQLIFLEKKSKKGITDFHIVKENETLYHISQIEAVRLDSILEYNKISKDDIPEIGEKIYLKSVALKKPKLKTAHNSTIK
jgi:LysM repeat protein